jgi:hypothetical protein
MFNAKICTSRNCLDCNRYKPGFDRELCPCAEVCRSCVLKEGCDYYQDNETGCEFLVYVDLVQRYCVSFYEELEKKHGVENLSTALLYFWEYLNDRVLKDHDEGLSSSFLFRVFAEGFFEGYRLAGAIYDISNQCHATKQRLKDRKK